MFRVHPSSFLRNKDFVDINYPVFYNDEAKRYLFVVPNSDDKTNEGKLKPEYGTGLIISDKLYPSMYIDGKILHTKQGCSYWLGSDGSFGDRKKYIPAEYVVGSGVFTNPEMAITAPGIDFEYFTGFEEETYYLGGKEYTRLVKRYKKETVWRLSWCEGDVWNYPFFYKPTEQQSKNVMKKYGIWGPSDIHVSTWWPAYEGERDEVDVDFKHELCSTTPSLPKNRDEGIYQMFGNFSGSAGNFDLTKFRVLSFDDGVGYYGSSTWMYERLVSVNGKRIFSVGKGGSFYWDLFSHSGTTFSWDNDLEKYINGVYNSTSGWWEMGSIGQDYGSSVTVTFKRAKSPDGEEIEDERDGKSYSGKVVGYVNQEWIEGYFFMMGVWL